MFPIIVYISNNPDNPMSRILIYTAEGVERSMGGLAWQGQRKKFRH